MDVAAANRADAAPYVAVVGPGDGATDEEYETARIVGRLLAERGAVVLTGGRCGVMEGASRGAHDAGGMVVAILPGSDRSAANPFVTVALTTGLGELRNGLLVRSADGVIAVGCSWGTLSEIALAVRTGVPIVGLGSWPQPAPGVQHAATPEEAVGALLG